MKKDIWVLTDNRLGNANQALGLAESIGESFIEKKISYNLFKFLPNFLLGATNIHINHKLSEALTPPYPKLLISSGRRTAPLALYIKSKDPQVKIIQIMRPFIGEKEIDLILLPQHDTYYSGLINIYRTVGAINSINKENLKNYAEEFYKNFSKDSYTKIAVIVGGSTKRYKFSTENGKNFISIVERLSINHGAKLFITFSRRTPKDLKDLFYTHFKANHYIYDPEQGGYNPYLGMLATADFLIATGDSISMCSDAATSGKPLYIYVPKNFNSSKHNYFVQQLVDLKIARRLQNFSDIMVNYEYIPLSEAKKAANFIKENIL